ncbi:hypothetical protein FJY70_00870, partial [candidate division WOR-3 bacterium]|nr:hypothetical protein [candidate division WOR-3 bacterium]
KVVLSYTGTEDDVIQAVELGDTRLTIPGTGYTGDLPAHHGLFGASARGKVGGVDLYAIASREQSQSQTQSFTGKRRVSVDTIYEYRYVTRRFYYLDAPGTITNLRVYVDDRNPGNNQSAYKAIATVFPDAPDSIPSHWTYDRAPGDFDLKSLGKDYLLQPGNVLEFTSQLGAQEVVGLVIYTNQDTIGGNKKQDTLILKLLKPQMPDSLSLTWDYELRNVYQLPQSDISLSSFSLQFNTPQGSPAIETDTAGANQGRKLTDILGLDPNLDGRLEYPEFDGKTGLVRFPGRRPFDSSALSTRDRIIYRVDPMSLDPGLGRMYRMVVEYSSAAESYYLGQPDISERSERVVVDGETWSRDRDYTIDYRSGVLSFLRALPPNANIQVTFEYRPLFSLAEKSLVGARAEYAPGPQGKLGASAFFRSEGANDEKPALGSEPFRRVIAETDASYTVNSDALTAFLDRLPLLRAQSPSSFGAAAEAAVSLPDPNTRGVAYLDDFEGTSVVRSVSNSALLWSYASVPVEKDTECFARTRLAWNSANRIRNDSVFGSTGEDDDYDRHDVLRVVFTPDPGDRASWAGMMTSAAQAGMSMNLKDVENLRMILKTRRTTGTIHVTVGMAIDEDAPRRNRAGAIVGLDGRNNTEDRNANGVLDEDEDTGLDTIAAADSLWVEGENGDDGNDDYHPVSNAMGTEGNQHLDAEDLDRNGFSRYNHYFECVLSLGDQRYFSDLALGWKLCRVSLRDSVCFKTVGKPRWEDIRYVRVWFDGFDEPDTIDFYSIEFVGSRWTNPQLGSTRDTARPPGRVPPDTTEKVWVTQVSRKTDATYTSPFQTKRDAQGRVEQEASLLLGYRNLNRHRRATVRKSSADREDYREYRELRLYVHDDGNGLVWLIRLGSDSANYYEYRDRITKGNLVPGRDGKWYEFVLPLDSFPILKQRRAQADVPVNVLWSSGPWRVLGNPSLADVRHTALGLENPDRTRISGGIWFNDLRLYGPRRETGYGFQARSNAALSDFVTVGATFDYSDPNFRRFSEGRGIKSGGGGFGANLGASLRANLDRLLPAGWGLSAPLSYSVSDQRDVPKYSPLYPDLRLASEGLGLTPSAASPFTARGRSEELAVDDLRKQKSANRWLNYTLEGMGFSWRARRARSLSSLTWDSTQASAARWLYSVSPDLKLKLGQDDELALFPQGIRFGLTDGRQSTRRGSRISLDSSYRVTVLKGHSLGTDFGVEYSPLEDLSFDYGVQTDRDLLVPSPDTFWFLKLGNESGREHSFDASYNLELADIFSPGIDYSGDYSDDRVKSGLGYDTLRNMNNSGELEFTLNTDLPELLGKLEPASGRPAKSGAQRHRPEPKPEPAPPEPVLPEPEPTGQEDSLPPVGEDSRPRQTPVGEDSRPRQTPVGEDSRPRQTPVGEDSR